jgi:hypothetical protein
MIPERIRPISQISQNGNRKAADWELTAEDRRMRIINIPPTHSQLEKTVRL